MIHGFANVQRRGWSRAWAESLALTVLLALPLATSEARAAQPSTAVAASPRGASAPAQRAPDPVAPRPATGPEGDLGTRSVAARARMSECGHQWNNMKRTGTATGTWKEFSRNCLAQK